MKALASPVASLSSSGHANMALVYTLFSGTDAHWAYKNVNLAMFFFLCNCYVGKDQNMLSSLHVKTVENES